MRPLLFAVAAVALSACASSPEDNEDRATSQTAAAYTKGAPIDPPPSKLAPPDPYLDTLGRYNGYDYDGDGVREIDGLVPLPLGGTPPPPPTNAPKGMVMIIVDPRVIAGSSTYSPAYMQSLLDLWGSDLRNEGFDPRFVQMTVRRNAAFPDGPIVLSMRRFLRDLRTQFNLTGAILVGDFPEGKILRSTLVRGEIRGDGADIGSTHVNNVDALWLNAELTALRTDLILADLDGNWESLYRPSMIHRNIVLVPDNASVSDPSWPQQYGGYYGSVFSSNVASYNDVFYIKDETAQVYDWMGLYIGVDYGSEPNPEQTASDKCATNPIARPEIYVSRINARHVGRKPVTAAGESLLDANGAPRSAPAGGPVDRATWIDDPATEIRVLVDFLQRDHAFRNGSDNALPFRVGAIRGPDLGLASPVWYSDMLRLAHPSLTSATPVVADHQDLIGYLDWLEQPAVLRAIITHASSALTVFTDGTVPVPPASQTEAKAGPSWFWQRSGTNLVPSWNGVGSGQMELYRALWENGKLQGKGSRFYVHHGCEVNSPANGSTASFVETRYAEFQNAESQLFFTNGLAVLSRAKVFFDGPENVGNSIAQKEVFGAALNGYIAFDSANANLAPLPWTATGMQRRGRTLDRKKTYTWSTIGDWTLRMKY